MKPIVALLLAVCAIPASAQTKKLAITPTLQATISHAPGARTVEVLIPGVEAIELDLTQPETSTFLIKTADYNFDGYKDFAFTSKEATPGAPTLFDIFLYHPEDKTFEALEAEGGACEGLSNVRVTAADKSLKASCKGATRSSTDVYRWDTPYTIALVKSTDNSADAAAEKAEEKAGLKTEKEAQRKEAREDRKAAKEAQEDEEE